MLLVPLDKNKVYKGQKFKQYVEEKMQFMFGNGRTQSNMCLKSVREIIF